MRSFNCELSWRLWVARHQAQLSTEPEFWLAEVRRLDALSNGDGERASELTERLVVYAEREAEASRQQMGAIRAGERPPPYGFLSELLLITHLALVWLGPAAKQPLLKAFFASQPRSASRLQLLYTLAHLGDSSLRSFFQDLRGSGEEERAARIGLDRLDGQVARAAFSPDKAAYSDSDEVLKQAVAALQHDNLYKRWQAAERLEELGDPRAVEPLRRLLDDPNDYVRKAAQAALARLSKPDA